MAEFWPHTKGVLSIRPISGYSVNFHGRLPTSSCKHNVPWKKEISAVATALCLEIQTKVIISQLVKNYFIFGRKKMIVSSIWLISELLPKRMVEKKVRLII